MPQPGNASTPLRVAIIGSGPSGFYAAEALFKHTELNVQIDMYDRLPTPHGLVRGGVAPDHPKIKSVSKVYDKTAANPNFRFYGYVEFGKDITHDEMKARYHAIIYAVGAQSDRHLGIPGEDLIGSHAATEFVAWYNAHPDFRNYEFDLSQQSAVVVGNGNVAMDVARILASSYEELRQTDIADYALEALRNSRITDVYLLGRRGPAQASFTNPELKELGELQEADVIVYPEEIELDPLSEAHVANNPDANVDKNLRTLGEYAKRTPSGKRKRIHVMFLSSPVEVIGDGQCVTAVKVVKNKLVEVEGDLKAVPTDQFAIIPTGLIFRSIGYKGVALPDVPFEPKRGVIPNDHGRVVDTDTKAVLTGEYAVGWIKRGPSGIIGTNKPDSVDTVNKLIEDLPVLPELDPAVANPDAVEQLIRERKPNYVSYADWLLLDQLEQDNGLLQSRPRIKFSRVEDMLTAIQRVKAQTSAD